MDMKPITIELLSRIRSNAPLIHNITNFVVMNSSANILLAVGASPVMAHCQSEVEEMASLGRQALDRLEVRLSTKKRPFSLTTLKAS